MRKCILVIIFQIIMLKYLSVIARKVFPQKISPAQPQPFNINF